MRDRLDDTHYMISIGSRVSMAVVAFYSGAHVLLPGERVLATWREESRLWHIQGVGKPIGGVAGTPVAYQPAVSADDGWWDSLNPASFDSAAQNMVLQDSGGVGGGFLSRGFVRFPAVIVAQGETISVATLDATQGANFGNFFIDVFGDDADDAVAPTSGANANGKTRTTAVLANVDTSTWPGSQGVTHEVGDVTTIIQEIVNRGGWSSGNAMQIFFDTIDNGGVLLTRHVRSFDHPTDPPATLNITLANPAIPTEQLASTDLSDFEEI